MISRRVLSVVLALVLSAVGSVVLWLGAIPYLQSTVSYRGGGPAAGAVLAIVFGLILIATAILTVVLSSAGVIAVGAVQLAGALLVFVGLGAGLVSAAFSSNPVLGTGLSFSIPTGVSALTGITFLGAGLAARVRRPGASVLGRIVSVAAAALLGPTGIVLVLAGGAMVYYRSMVVNDNRFQPLALLLLAAGAVLLGAIVYSARWSSAGAIVLGLGLSVLGFVALADPLLLNVAPGVPELSSTLVNVSGSGGLALVGVVMLAAGVGVRFRGARAAASV